MVVSKQILEESSDQKIGPTEEAIEFVKPYKYIGRGVIEPAIELENFLNIIIRKCNLINRSQLSKLTKIPRTTIYDYIENLCAEERVEKVSVLNKKRGRPVIYYKALKY